MTRLQPRLYSNPARSDGRGQVRFRATSLVPPNVQLGNFGTKTPSLEDVNINGRL